MAAANPIRHPTHTGHNACINRHEGTDTPLNETKYSYKGGEQAHSPTAGARGGFHRRGVNAWKYSTSQPGSEHAGIYGCSYVMHAFHVCAYKHDLYVWGGQPHSG